MFRRIFVLFLLVVITSAFSAPVAYQGKLTNTGGVGINDTVDIAMFIYDAPTLGTVVDADTAESVAVYKGLFSTIFDLDIPSSYITGALYAEIQIDDGGGFVAITPRQQINAEFRAMWADNAIDAVYADTAYYVVAGSTFYDNTVSGLTATDVQAAIDELAAMPHGGSLQEAYDLGNTITGDNSVSITLNPGHGRALYAKVGKDGISTSTSAAVYARNDSTGPAIYASGNIVQATGKYFGTNGDTRILLDINNNSTDHFRVYNGDTVNIFDIDEAGLVTTNSIIAGDSIELGGVWRDTWPTGGAVNDSNFIQNQDTVAQPAKFWIANRGVVGGVTSYSDVDMIFGFGTSGSSTKPFAGWYHYARNVSMITAAEIGAGGATTIDSLSIYLQTPSTTDPWTFDSVYIWLELTTATSVPTTWDVSGATQVYYVLAEAIPQVAGWYHFDISDFVYDGTSNLLIYFQDGYQSTNYASGGPQWRYTTMATSDYNAYDYDDSSWPTALTSSTARTDFRLSFTGFPSVIDQVVIENGTVDADNDLLIGGTSLTGTGGAGLIGYDNTTSGLAAVNVQDAIDEIVGVANGGKDTLWTVAEDPADTMIIMAQTKIYGELIADSIQAVGDTVYFDDNISVSCAKFGGGAVPSDTLLIEGFEGGTFPPTGWTQNYVIGTTDWTQTTTDAHSGLNSARFYYNTVYGDRTELITPTINLSAYTNAYLEFWHYQNVWVGDQDSLEVYYSDDGGTSWNLLVGYYNDIASWTFASIPLPSLSATYQVKFLGIEEYGHGVYLDDVFIYAPTGASPPSAEICAGNINADGNLDIGGNATIGDTLEALHYRDSGGNNLLRSSDASVVIAEDLDGSWDLTVVGSGGPVPTLDQCYNSGSPGGGRSILAVSGPVDINANGSTNGALNLSADDPASAVLYINHGAIPPGNGIWNDGNYWSPIGNIALGTGYYHTNNGLFQSNVDFICKIDADDNADNTFQVQNSVGAIMFEVDEYGNSTVTNDLIIPTGGINDGIGTGLAGMILTADGAGHFNWAFPTGGGGFQQLRADGAAWLTDSVTLVQGANITLTQTGDSITIAAIGGAGDNDWTRTGNLLTTFNTTDSVGIGVAAPLYKLHVEGEPASFGEAVGYFQNNDVGANDGAAVYAVSVPQDYYGYGVYGEGGYVGVEGDVYPTGSHSYYGVEGLVYGGDGSNYALEGEAYGDGENYGVYASAYDNGSGTSNNYGIYAVAAGGDTNWAGYFDGDVYVAGNVGIGTETPGDKLHVDGGNIFLDNGNRYYGVDATQADSFWFYDDGDTTRFNSDNPIKVGNASLVVETDGDVNVSQDLTVDGTIYGDGSGLTGIGGGFQQLRADGNAWLTDSVTLVQGANITLTQTGDSITIAAVGGAGDNDWTRAGNLLTTFNTTDSVGIGVAAPQYKLHVEGETNDYEAVGYFKNTSAAGSDIDGYGVYGECANDDYFGYGVYGVGGYMGVEGDVYPTGSDYYYGVSGSVAGGDGSNYALYGDAYGDGENYGVYASAYDNGSGTSNNYGIYAVAAGGDTNWAAYLDGDVYVDIGIDLNGNGAVIGETYRTDWEAQNVITVGMANADFTDLELAINVANGLPNAIIKIAPGTYNITAAVPVLPTVVLRGSGQQNTIVTGALIDFNPNSEAYYIHFDNDINLAGVADGCWFTGNVQMLAGLAVARNCNFDNAGGTDTLGLLDGGRIEQCDFNMAISGEGDWTISDCKFNVAATFHSPAAGLTEVHIDGCDVIATITLTGSGVFGYIESNKFSTSDGGPGIHVGEDAGAEIKANHFIDCIVGVDAGANADVTVLSNNFVSCSMTAVLGLNCDRLDIIGNDVVGMGITADGFNIIGLMTGVVKDNKIEHCVSNGMILDAMMDFVIDNNVCEGNTANGILINGGAYQILHNTLKNNGDGTTTFDLNDASGAPSSVASYNVLDTYSPSGAGAWAGAFNTNSAGIMYAGAQPGQLP